MGIKIKCMKREVRFKHIPGMNGMKNIFIYIMLLGLIAIVWSSSPAEGANLFASAAGSGSLCTQDSPCALQNAVDLANSGDTIYAAQGIYTASGSAVVTLNKSVSLLGGWDGSSAGAVVRIRTLYPSIIDGQNARRAVHIEGAISPTIDGFTVTGGNASGLGGGEFWFGKFDAGGGIYSSGASPIIRNNIIKANVASVVMDARTMGGGVYVQDAFSPALITGNKFISNTAGGPTTSQAEGGGLFIKGPAHVVGNDFIFNMGKESVVSIGGAICAGYTYGPADIVISGNYFEGNSGTRGGAIFVVYSSADVTGNTMLKNIGAGAGIFLYQDEGSKIEKNIMMDNTVSSATANNPELFSVIMIDISSRPGFSSKTTRILNNILAVNSSDHQSPGTFSDIYVYNENTPGTVEIIHNTVVSAGHGILVGENTNATILNNIITGHAVGINTVGSGSVSVNRNLFWQNTDDGVRGNEPVNGDPLFVDPSNDNYHISKISPARDTASSSSVSDDFEGDERPFGASFDIGADEYRPVVYVEQQGHCGGRTPCYSLLNNALSEAEDGAQVMTASGSYNEGQEGFVFNRNAHLTIVGGLDPSDFHQTSSPTVLNGLQIQAGSLTVYMLHLQAVP